MNSFVVFRRILRMLAGSKVILEEQAVVGRCLAMCLVGE